MKIKIILRNWDEDWAHDNLLKEAKSGDNNQIWPTKKYAEAYQRSWGFRGSLKTFDPEMTQWAWAKWQNAFRC